MNALPFSEPAFRQAVAHEMRRGGTMAEAMRTMTFATAKAAADSYWAIRAAPRGDHDEVERIGIEIMDTLRGAA